MSPPAPARWSPPLPLQLDSLLDAMRHLDVWIQAIGYAGLFAIVFVETGLFFGFFLPGDTLLLTAGILAQRGHFDIEVLVPLLIIAAITGDATGYAIGRRAGPLLFVRDDALLFRRRHLERAREFFDRHGGKAIVLARFVPIVRTFAPPAAGAAGMAYGRFTLWNVSGGVLWVGSMAGAGYVLGNTIPNLDLLLIAVVFVVSVAPIAWHWWRERAGRG